MPRGMHEYARQQKLDVEYADVMNMIREHYRGEPESAWMLERPVDLKATGASELAHNCMLTHPSGFAFARFQGGLTSRRASGAGCDSPNIHFALNTSGNHPIRGYPFRSRP
jgi:hypothetical protein